MENKGKIKKEVIDGSLRSWSNLFSLRSTVGTEWEPKPSLRKWESDNSYYNRYPITERKIWIKSNNNDT